MINKILTNAAVLVPIYRDLNNDLKIVIIRRSLNGIHGGQLAFPGGRVELSDTSLFHTALREANEEIGLPSESVTLLEELPPIETIVSGYLIYPFLAKIKPPKTWIIQEEEIAEVITLNISELANEGAHATDMFQFEDWPDPKAVSYYKVGPYQLWGASYRILKPLLPRLLNNEFEI